MKACIVIPCYNHTGTVGDVARAAAALLPVIVVDDGSTERVEVPEGVTLIRFEQNRGKGAALRAAFERATQAGFTHAVTIDADGQHAAEDIPKILEAAAREPGALVVGVRDFAAAGAPTARRRSNEFSNFWVRVETGVRLPDTQCGFRCYPLGPTLALRVRAERYAYELEALVRAAWTELALVTVPVGCTYQPEQVQRSHFRPLVDTLRISQLNMKLSLQAWFAPASLRKAWSLRERQTMGQVLREFFVEHAHEPGRLACAVGLGLFCGVAPIWGWQMVVAAAVAHRLQLNKVIALLASNISILPLAPVILWGGLETGHRMFTGQWLEISVKAMTRSTISEHLLHWVVGSLVLAAATGAAGAALTYAVARLVRRR